jgi:hydrogenase expression/formation protein HypC
MCLAYPAKIIEVKGDTALADFSGARRRINVILTPNVKPGNWVLVHAGFAIQVVSEHDARENLKLIKETIGEPIV